VAARAGGSPARAATGTTIRIRCGIRVAPEEIRTLMFITGQLLDLCWQRAYARNKMFISLIGR